ncbi:hypothetical protein Mapa_004710 [Marchantia paleacea]|nr:hypothetical protein Mapa_004710 [Marchantia paleacea]
MPTSRTIVGILPETSFIDRRKVATMERGECDGLVSECQVCWRIGNGHLPTLRWHVYCRVS